jgi:hypothetical protein
LAFARRREQFPGSHGREASAFTPAGLKSGRASSKILMSKTTEIYLENSQAMAKDARTELLLLASKDWAAAKQAATEAGKLEIVAINKIRDCGLKLQEASDREHFSFTFFTRVQDQLPMGFAEAKFAVNLARKLDKPVTTLDEARQARRVLFEALGAATAPKRIGEQSAHEEENPWSIFINTAATFTSLFEKLDDEPMEKWKRDKLKKFVQTTKPIVEKHEAAVALLKK